MKKQLFNLVAIFMIAGFSNNAMAQNQVVSADADAHAVIVAPLTIEWAQDLDFGTIAVHATIDGTVTVSPLSVISNTGGTSLPVTGTITPHAAHFDLTGESGYLIDIALPASHIIKSGANSMTVSSFTSDGDGGNLVSNLAAATDVLKIGATLTVPAAQPAGTYAGEDGFTVTVNYN